MNNQVFLILKMHGNHIFYIRHIRDLDWVFLHCIENSYPCCPYSCMYDCFSGFWIKMRIMSRDNKHTKILVQKKWNNVFPSFGFHWSLFIFQVTCVKVKSSMTNLLFWLALPLKVNLRPEFCFKTIRECDLESFYKGRSSFSFYVLYAMELPWRME